MDANQAKAEFLHSKIPAFRRHQPWDSQTDLLVDDILEEFDEMWPLWEQVLPGLDVERDVPITISQAVQLRDTLEKCRVHEFRESGVRPRGYWTYWGVGHTSDWAYWGIRR
ncbi:hypothetical protein F4604DRAFT_1685945 [Suillus subluteus]|nr:hypothetical protein F4604DRAFT_1685945 [Suillus subluteus]